MVHAFVPTTKKRSSAKGVRSRGARPVVGRRSRSPAHPTPLPRLDVPSLDVEEGTWRRSARRAVGRRRGRHRGAAPPCATRAGDALAERLRRDALARYPGAHLKAPGGHLDLAVKDKTFAYLSVPGALQRVVQVAHAAALALDVDGAAPGYGLARAAGSRSRRRHAPPRALLEAWIDELPRRRAEAARRGARREGLTGRSGGGPGTPRRRAAPRGGRAARASSGRRPSAWRAPR